jgi:hypothetical protein
MSKGSRWIAAQINRDIDSVRKRANKLNILLPVIVDGQECHKFSPKEDYFIRQNSDRNAVWIARQLHMSVRSIRRRANLIKIKLPVVRKKYTPSEEQFIKDNIDKGITYIADQLNVSRDAIRMKIEKINK